MKLPGISEKLENAKASVQERAEELGETGLNKVNEWLDDFNKVMILLDEYGFKIESLNVGSGLAPNINTSIRGSLENVHEDAISKLLEEHQKQQIMAATLRAVLTAKSIKSRIDVLPLTDIRIFIKLGWPPEISIDFV